MNSSDPTSNKEFRSDSAQSFASRYGPDFLAAWKDSESSDKPAMPTDNQYPVHKAMTSVSGYCYCAQCQPVIDRLTRISNPPQSFYQHPAQAQQLQQQQLQDAYYHRNRSSGFGYQPAITRRINEAYHNRRQPTENPPIRTERVPRPPPYESGAVQASPENIAPPQSLNVDLQNMYYHQRPKDSDGRAQSAGNRR